MDVFSLRFRTMILINESLRGKTKASKEADDEIDQSFGTTIFEVTTTGNRIMVYTLGMIEKCWHHAIAN